MNIQPVQSFHQQIVSKVQQKPVAASGDPDGGRGGNDGDADDGKAVNAPKAQAPGLGKVLDVSA